MESAVGNGHAACLERLLNPEGWLQRPRTGPWAGGTKGCENSEIASCCFQGVCKSRFEAGPLVQGLDQPGDSPDSGELKLYLPIRLHGQLLPVIRVATFSDSHLRPARFFQAVDFVRGGGSLSVGRQHVHR